MCRENDLPVRKQLVGRNGRDAAPNAADRVLASSFRYPFPVVLVQKDFAYVLASLPLVACSESVPTLMAAHQLLVDATRRGFLGLSI